MSSLSSLIVVSVLVAGGQTGSAEEASLSFVSENDVLAGTSHGIDAIDAQARAFGQRLSASISAGRKTVWYSCPGAPRMTGGSRVTFDFDAGQHYELVCRPGKDAEIQLTEEC